MDSECFKSVSQCANLGFRYFNVTVHSYAAKCTARKILLLLELKKLEQEKDDSVHLDVCIGGKRKYSFWSYPVCYTTTELEEGGREAVFISCSKANETLSSHDPSTSATVPIWVPVVVTVLAVLVVIVLLGTCAYQCYRCKTGRTAGQERYIYTQYIIYNAYTIIYSIGAHSQTMIYIQCMHMYDCVTLARIVLCIIQAH